MPALLVAIGLFGLLLALRYAPAWRRQASVARRRRAVGRAVQVGHRPGHRGPRDRARDERLPALARGPRARDRAHALVPRAADARARALGAAGRALGDLAQRAPAVQPAPVDELRDRAAVRARQRRHPRDRRPARRRGHLADHARDLLRLRRRQAARHPRRLMARRRGRGCAGRARRSAGRRSRGGGAVAGIGFTVSLLVSSLAFHGERLAEAKLGVLAAAIARAARWRGPCSRSCRRLPAERARAPDRRHRRGPARPRRRRRPRARPHPRPRRRARHAGRVRRLRVPLLRSGRGRRSASC